MTSRTALNLGLLVAVAGLAWLVLRPSPESAGPGVAVGTVSPRAVTQIRIERAGEPDIALRLQDGRWRLDTPIAAPADGFRVQALLGLLEARSATSFPVAGIDLRQYELSPPLANLHFNASSLAVGAREPVKGRRYLLDPVSDQVHLIEDGWFSQIFGDAPGWVDPRPLPEGSTPVAILLPAVRWRLEQGSWRREPPAPSVSADTGVALADAWRRARALSVATLDPQMPWAGEVSIGLAGRDEALRLRVAVSANAVLLGRADLGVQYRFLKRQGKVLLADDAPQ